VLEIDYANKRTRVDVRINTDRPVERPADPVEPRVETSVDGADAGGTDAGEPPAAPRGEIVP
jgi:hypothetical protein